MVKILLAGDGFVTVDVLRRAIERHLPNAELVELTNEWPITPFSDGGGVKEAQGDENELIAALHGCDVCITHTRAFTEKVFAASPDLKVVTVCRGGPVNADAAAATRHGVAVTFTPGRNATATTEHTVAMILAAVRQVAQRHVEVMRGDWRGDHYLFDRVGPEIRGSVVGLVGLGAVGSRVASIMSAMGARVLVYDPYLDPARIPKSVTVVAELDDLLAQSNILTIHARLTAENAQMIGAEQIARMPQGSILVNCARGGLLDYEALCDALESGHLWAAACDVLPSEPLPKGHRLLKQERLTLTPHLGGASKQAAELAAQIGARDIAAFLDGRSPDHLANPEILHKS